MRLFSYRLGWLHRTKSLKETYHKTRSLITMCRWFTSVRNMRLGFLKAGFSLSKACVSESGTRSLISMPPIGSLRALDSMHLPCSARLINGKALTQMTRTLSFVKAFHLTQTRMGTLLQCEALSLVCGCRKPKLEESN